jgi:hypothetical protein
VIGADLECEDHLRARKARLSDLKSGEQPFQFALDNRTLCRKAIIALHCKALAS